jgi:hypothetical protein
MAAGKQDGIAAYARRKFQGIDAQLTKVSGEVVKLILA